MYRAIEGVYRRGVIEPLEKVEAEEGTKAIITFLKSYIVSERRFFWLLALPTGFFAALW